MLAILKTLIDIALLRREPSDLPASTRVLVATIAALFSLMIVRGMFLVDGQKSSGAGLQLFFLMLLLSMAWYWAVLIAFRKPERYLQMTTAIIGIECLVAAATLPFVPALPSSLGSVPAQPSLAMLLLVIVYFYGVFLTARIIAITIEKSFGVGLLLWVVPALSLWLLFGPRLGPTPAGN